MKNWYIKPVLIGILGGVLLLLINLIVLYGSFTISDLGEQGGKDTVVNPLATPTPTPTRDDTGFLLVLIFVNYILAPVIVAATGVLSVWSAPVDRSTPSGLLLISAIPGAISMLVFTLVIWLYSLTGFGAPQGPGFTWFWLSAMAVYLVIGTICSTAGGIICSMASGMLFKKSPNLPVYPDKKT